MSVGEEIVRAVGADFAVLGDATRLTQTLFRLLLAAALGGLVGWERTRAGKAAGLRTHMLVSLGSAFFVLVPKQLEMTGADLSRVIQGVVVGVGFIGGGAILKHGEGRVEGLTTAAGLWVAAAVGMAAGLGRGGAAVIAAVLTLAVLAGVGRLEAWADLRRNRADGP